MSVFNTGPKTAPTTPCAVCNADAQFQTWGQWLCDRCAGAWFNSGCPGNEAATAAWAQKQKRGAA